MKNAPSASGTHRLGALALSVGEGVPGSSAILDELRPLHGSAPGRQLTVRFVRQLPELEDARFYKPVTVGRGNSYQVTHRQLSYQVDFRTDGLDLTVAPHVVEERRLAAALNRWRDWNYLDQDERIAKTFFYEAFDYLVQAAQLNLGQSWLHAGGVERDGKAVLFTGWGGVGKTTATLKLVLERGYRFISDDLAVISSDGCAYRGPKKLQVYGYNLVGEPILARRLMRGRGPLDRTSWNRKLRRAGPSGVRRRTSAEKLLGSERVASEAEISALVLIERGDVRNAVHTDLDTDRFAARSAATVVRELSPFSGTANAYHSAEIDLEAPHLPTVIDLTEKTREIIRRGSTSKPLVQVTLPRSAGPRDVLREVDRYL